MTTPVILIIVSVLIMNTVFAMMAKAARIVKSKRAKILLLIPPFAIIILGVWAYYELFKRFFFDYFKSEE